MNTTSINQEHWSNTHPRFLRAVPKSYRWPVFRSYWVTRFVAQYGLLYFIRKIITAPRITTWPPFYINVHAPFELHIVTCHGDLLLCLWSLASWYGVGLREDRLCIHDDGTLTSRDCELVSRLFPGSRIISKAEADTVVTGQLAEFPAIRRYRSRHVFAMKIIDVLLLSATTRVILMDSDVVTFTAMSDIESSLPNRGNIFLRDYQYAFTLGRSDFERFGASSEYVPLNAGFGVVERETLDLPRLEMILTDSQKITRFLDWTEQTLYALLSSRRGVHLLDNRFVVARGKGLHGVKLKHYVTLCRRFAFVEGIPFVNSVLTGRIHDRRV